MSTGPESETGLGIRGKAFHLRFFKAVYRNQALKKIPRAQRLPNPLIKEYTLNRIRDPIIISGLLLN